MITFEQIQRLLPPAPAKEQSAFENRVEKIRRAALDCIAQHGYVTNSMLADNTGNSPEMLNRYLRRFESEGLLVCTQKTGHRRNQYGKANPIKQNYFTLVKK